MYEDFIQIKGKTPGPISIILAGVHGNETCGIKAFESIIPNLKIEFGEVIFGYGNPRAIAQNKRFTDTNLNRLFKDAKELSIKEKGSYEYGRAQIIKKYLDKADALLDIHSSSVPESKSFIICEENSAEIVKFIGINLIVSGFDEIEPGGTDYYMNNKGKIGICVECGYLGNKEAIQVAKESLLSFLKARGHVKNNLSPQKQTYIHIYKLYLSKTSDFTLSKPFENFERIEENQIIGTDGEEQIRSKKKSLILFAHNATQIGTEVFLLGEEKDSI